MAANARTSPAAIGLRRRRTKAIAIAPAKNAPIAILMITKSVPTTRSLTPLARAELVNHDKPVDFSVAGAGMTKVSGSTSAVSSLVTVKIRS